MLEEEKEYTTSEEYVLTAVQYINKENYDEAKKYLLKAHELFPDNIHPISYLLSIEAQKNLKEGNYQKNNIDEEIRLRYKFIEILEIKKSYTGYMTSDIHPYLTLGNFLRLSKRYQEAIEISKKALALVEDEDLQALAIIKDNYVGLKASLYSRLSNEYFEYGDYKQSLIYADKSLEIDPKNQHIEGIKKKIFEIQNSK
jgi:tetratricopeptide (TPR) repeat protein